MLDETYLKFAKLEPDSLSLSQYLLITAKHTLNTAALYAALKATERAKCISVVQLVHSRFYIYVNHIIIITPIFLFCSATK